MEKEKKPSIRAEIQVADGKVATLQADPECREVSRMVADLNRRVVRVQTHGLTSWERQVEKGRPRGYGVEVAHEAAEGPEPEPGSARASAYYGGADEPQQPAASPVVEQYLENLERIEGKPGPIKRTLRRWMYGKRIPQGAATHGDGCYCRQVEVVAGKMTIAEASDMQDDAVDRLLVDVYFHSPPENRIGSVFRNASQMTRRFSERVKSTIGQIRHSRTKSRVEEGASQMTSRFSERVKSTIEQIRHSRTKSRVEEGAQAMGEDETPPAEALQLRQSRPAVVVTGPQDSGEQKRAPDRSSLAKQRKDELKLEEEAAARQSRVSSRKETQFYDAESGPSTSGESDRPGEQHSVLRSGRNTEIYYQVTLEGGGRNAGESNANKLPQPLNLTPHLGNAKVEILQEDKRLNEDGETSRLPGESTLPECDHHRTVTGSDWQINEVCRNLGKTVVNSERSTTNFERSSVCSLAPPASENPILPDRESVNGKDSRTIVAQLAGERPEQRLEESKQTRPLHPKDQRRTLELFIMRSSSEFELQTPSPERELSDEMTLASHHIGELDFEEGAEDNQPSSAHPNVGNKPPDERPLPDSDACWQTGCTGPSCVNAKAEGRERKEERATKEGRKTI